ncbi:MAG TPA: glycosyltransferase family 4 protein [Thermoleophilaceae bacterium]|nr:glycosyltransferase family 4 protein [Thermoleophilaceae bacterium]
MSPSVCFILGELGPSGGAGAVVRHARGLAADHGWDVSLALWPGASAAVAPPGVRVVATDEARLLDYDVAIATWWRTAYDLFAIPARRHAYFVQQFEERTYRPGDVERFGAIATHDLPVAFLTEAAWIAEELAELRPDASCFHVPNGIDKQRFAPGGRSPSAGPLRVLVEGSPGLWFKGIQDAAAALELTREPVVTTLVTPERVDADTCARFDHVVGPLDHAAMADAYRGADVLLKLSRVEGVFTPPLEAFHCAVPCVVWPVTGHDEYVRHGVNGAVVDFDDLIGTAGWLDLLARDRGLLAKLGDGALETATAWPSWDRSTSAFAAALAEIAGGPPPSAGAGAARLLADLDAAMEEQRAALSRERGAAEHANAWLADTRRELAHARATNVAFEQSRTWRYAAPLRAIGGRLRRLRATFER